MRTYEETLEAAQQILTLLSAQADHEELKAAAHEYLNAFDRQDEARESFLSMAGAITIIIIVLADSGASVTLGHEETMKYVNSMIRRSEN